MSIKRSMPALQGLIEARVPKAEWAQTHEPDLKLTIDQYTAADDVTTSRAETRTQRIRSLKGNKPQRSPYRVIAGSGQELRASKTMAGALKAAKLEKEGARVRGTDPTLIRIVLLTDNSESAP